LKGERPGLRRSPAIDSSGGCALECTVYSSGVSVSRGRSHE
jgi:hypothetical protein